MNRRFIPPELLNVSKTQKQLFDPHKSWDNPAKTFMFSVFFFLSPISIDFGARNGFGKTAGRMEGACRL